jgi:hypothetical protein
MAEYVRSEGAPGVVLLVRNRSGTWRATSGLARLDPPRPIRAGDRFRVASITKTFVATVVLQLVSEGRLRLDDPVARRLPDVGLGIFRRPVACGYAWGNGGVLAGYRTEVLTNRDGSHVVVVTANGYSPRVAGAVTASAANAYCTS